MKDTDKVKSFGCKPIYLDSIFLGRLSDDIGRLEINLSLGCKMSSLEVLSIWFLTDCLGISLKKA